MLLRIECDLKHIDGAEGRYLRHKIKLDSRAYGN